VSGIGGYVSVIAHGGPLRRPMADEHSELFHVERDGDVHMPSLTITLTPEQAAQWVETLTEYTKGATS